MRQLDAVLKHTWKTPPTAFRYAHTKGHGTWPLEAGDRRPAPRGARSQAAGWRRPALKGTGKDQEPWSMALGL